MSARLLTCICLMLTSCSDPPQMANVDGWQSYSLGTMPLRYAAAGEQRYLVSVQRRYLANSPDLGEESPAEPPLLDNSGRIFANNVRFGVQYPSLEPAQDPWARDSIRLTIGNMIEDGISKSVDGSWQNHYSGYKISLPDKHGLHVRRRDDYSLDDRLYFIITPELHVRIECRVNAKEPDKWCLMAARRPGQPCLETGFYAADLPEWRHRLSRLQTLFRSEGKQSLGASPQS